MANLSEETWFDGESEDSPLRVANNEVESGSQVPVPNPNPESRIPGHSPRGCDYFLSPTKVGNRIFSLNRPSSSIVQYHSPISTRGRSE